MSRSLCLAFQSHFKIIAEAGHRFWWGRVPRLLGVSGLQVRPLGDGRLAIGKGAHFSPWEPRSLFLRGRFWILSGLSTIRPSDQIPGFRRQASQSQFELKASVRDVVFSAALICSSVAEDFKRIVTGSAGSRSK